MQEPYAFTIRAGSRELTATYSLRDSCFLGGALLPEAIPFLSAIGKWDNFTVAKGMNIQAWTPKPAAPLIDAANALFDRLIAESELFEFDYQYSFPERATGQKNSGAQSGFKAYDHHCAVNAKTPGQLYLSLLFCLDDPTHMVGKSRTSAQKKTYPPVGAHSAYTAKKRLPLGSKNSLRKSHF